MNTVFFSLSKKIRNKKIILGIKEDLYEYLRSMISKRIQSCNQTKFHFWTSTIWYKKLCYFLLRNLISIYVSSEKVVDKNGILFWFGLFSAFYELLIREKIRNVEEVMNSGQNPDFFRHKYSEPFLQRKTIWSSCYSQDLIAFRRLFLAQWPHNQTPEKLNRSLNSTICAWK